MTKAGLIAAFLSVASLAAAGAQNASLKSERAAASTAANSIQLNTRSRAATTVKAPAAPAAEDGPKAMINREVFQYDGAGRRDPFLSLIGTTDLRPMLSDLKLVAIAFDPRGKNSVAVLRDVTSKDQYKVRVGQTLGRMRVAAIQEKAVLFTIEEFGYSRQELLPIQPPDSSKMRLRQ